MPSENTLLRFCFASLACSGSLLAVTPAWKDSTESVFSESASWKRQLRPGAEHWLGRIDRFAGADVWSFHGIAAGDFNGDGNDDIYICQQGGLPNCLFVNSNGQAHDVAALMKVDLLDQTKTALWADLDNDGDQDLVLAAAGGVAILENRWPEPFAGRCFWSALRNVVGISAGDLDGDGVLDLILVRHQSDLITSDLPAAPDLLPNASNGASTVLMHGTGGFGFSPWQEVVDERFLRLFGNSALVADFNGDSFPDLVLANACGDTVFLVNKLADKSVRRLEPLPSPREGHSGLGVRSVLLADFQRKGHFDFLGSGAFADALSPTAGVEWFRSWTDSRFYFEGGRERLAAKRQVWPGKVKAQCVWGAVACDFNLDGYDDLAFSSGGVSWDKPSGPDSGSYAKFYETIAKEMPAPDVLSAQSELASRAFAQELRRGANWQPVSQSLQVYENVDGNEFKESKVPFLPGDGRSVAALDWNGDGKPDLFALGRTAPQLSFVENVTPTTNGLRVILDQVKGARDAIGSTLSVRLSDGRQLDFPITSGGGFLGQSGKGVFVGCEAASVVSLSVKWASTGLEETFKPSAMGRKWLLRQGTGSAADISPTATPPIPEVVSSALNQSFAGKFFATGNEPILPIKVQNIKGEVLNLNERFDRPTLLVLFEAGDPASRRYLKELAEADRRLRLAGTRVIGLAVDPLPKVARRSLPGSEASKLLASMELPFFVGLLDESGWAKLKLAFEAPFVRVPELKLPAVWMLNSTGAVHLLYDSPPKPDDVVQDVKAYSASNGNRWKLSLPFGGRWLIPPETIAGAEMAAELADRQSPLEAWKHIQANSSLFGPSIPYARFLAELGVQLRFTGNYRESIDCFREALRIAPNTPSLLNNLAWVLVSSPDPLHREPIEALRLARQANALAGGGNPVFSDTLSVCLAANDLIPEAIDEAIHALELAQKAKETDMIKDITQRIELFRQGKSWPP